MNKIIITALTLITLSSSSFAEQSEEGMNNREAMHQMALMIKHEMDMMQMHMAALTVLQHQIESMEAGGSISKHN
jgi:hypothetical protein